MTCSLLETHFQLAFIFEAMVDLRCILVFLRFMFAVPSDMPVGFL